MIDEIIRRRRALHRIPETGFELSETLAFVLNEVSAWECEVVRVAKTGLICFFNAGKNETYAFRSDMDALNIAEASGVDFCSMHPGKMHACGHDGHMSMLLALGDWANANRERLKRNILLIFQPAEETSLGAEMIVKSGVLQRYGVSRVYALHVDPWNDLGVIATRPGPMMARTSELYVTFQGKASHAAMADKGCDAVAALCEFICEALQMEREIDAGVPRLLKFGMINGGTAVNIIAGEAKTGGTMRAFSDSVYEGMKKSVYDIAQSVCDRYKTTYDIDLNTGAPAVINDGKLFEEAARALADMNFATLPQPTMIAEDFSMYSAIAPILMLFVGTGGGIALHAANFTLDERALECGARALIRLADF